MSIKAMKRRIAALGASDGDEQITMSSPETGETWFSGTKAQLRQLFRAVDGKTRTANWIIDGETGAQA